MARKPRKEEPPSAQASFGWADAKSVISSAPDGEVVYEAPELRRRPRKAVGATARTLGLPFGAREADGHAVCWSCGCELADESVIRVGPGDARCPGCGAKLPFFL